MDVILIMPSEEDRKANPDTSEQWAYEILVVGTAKDMVKKLMAKRPASVLIDSGMVSKLTKHDFRAVSQKCSLTVLPQHEHNRILKEVRAHAIGRANRIPSVEAMTKGMKGAKFRRRYVKGKAGPPVKVVRGEAGAPVKFVRGKAGAPVKVSRSILAKQQGVRYSQQVGTPRVIAVPPPHIILPELHDPANGRVDAKKIADYLAISLSKLSAPLGVDYGTVHKTPSAERLQPALRPIKRSLEILSQAIGNQKTVRAWLNIPHPFLDKKTPLQIIQEGHADQLETILENAVEGIPY